MAVSSFMTLFLSMLQDSLGRKKFFFFSFAFVLSGFLCAFFGNSIVFVLLGLVLMWSYAEVSLM